MSHWTDTDDCQGDWKSMPDAAPYPRHWTPQQRLDMTWYARQNHIHVDYDPNAEDEGASLWQPAFDAMERNKSAQRSRITAARERGTAKSTLDLEQEEPHPYDTSEPRHPNPIGDW